MTVKDGRTGDRSDSSILVELAARDTYGSLEALSPHKTLPVSSAVAQGIPVRSHPFSLMDEVA